MLFWPLGDSGINDTLWQIYWHWPKCIFVVWETQYWRFPLVSAGIWQYNHFPIYSFCNIMRCIPLGPHCAKLWLNNMATVPSKSKFLHMLHTYLGLRNWNHRGHNIHSCQHTGTCPGKASPSIRGLLRRSSRGDRSPRSCSAVFCAFLLDQLMQPCCHPAGSPAGKGATHITLSGPIQSSSSSLFLIIFNYPWI